MSCRNCTMAGPVSSFGSSRHLFANSAPAFSIASLILLPEPFLCSQGGSPYEGAAFAVSVAFPADYPFKPPTVTPRCLCPKPSLTRYQSQVTFSNPRQIYHPNVNEEGLICLDLLKTKYSPACSMPQVFNAIHTLLQVPSTGKTPLTD